MRAAKIASFALLSVLTSLLGVAEDHYDFLGPRLPEWLWCPALFFVASLITATCSALFWIAPGRSFLHWLAPLSMVLGVSLNCFAINRSETIEISSAFEGSLTEDEWRSLDIDGRDLAKEFGSAFPIPMGANLGIRGVTIRHATVSVGGSELTQYSVAVECRTRAVPRRYRGVPVDLAVNYFWIKLQFVRHWKDQRESGEKRRQTAGNFFIVMKMAGAREPILSALVHSLSVSDPNPDVRSVFGEYEQRGARKAVAR